jgi:hypothetical protein
MSQIVAKVAQFGVNNFLYLPLKTFLKLVDRNNNFQQAGRFLHGSYVYGNNFGMYYTGGKNLAYTQYDSTTDSYNNETVSDILMKTIIDTDLQPVDLVDASAMIHDIELTADKSFKAVLNANFKVIDNIIKSTDPYPLIKYPAIIITYPLSVIVSVLYWGFENLFSYPDVKFDQKIYNLTSYYQKYLDNSIQLNENTKFKINL